jgi:hypothetical protein
MTISFIDGLEGGSCKQVTNLITHCLNSNQHLEANRVVVTATTTIQQPWLPLTLLPVQLK